jgi:hypothetical protein
MSLARDLDESGVADIAVFKFAYSGTAFSGPDPSGNQYNDWRAGDPLYDEMLSRLAEARLALEDGGANTVTLRGFFWIQGGSDSRSATYASDLGAFISDLRGTSVSQVFPST